MSNTTRELLLITKTARQWHDAFDRQVDAIIETINRVDTVEEVARTTEVLDVYHHVSSNIRSSSRRRNRTLEGDKPFEFLSFRN